MAPLVSVTRDELSIQARVQGNQLAKITQAVSEVYPGGHPALEVLPLKNGGHQYSMGRIGTLAQSMTVREFADYCKTVFQVPGLRLVARDLDKPVQRVAVLGGDGGKFFKLAQSKGADIYVTGDVYYHTGHDMLAANFPVVDPGHHIESICKPKLAELFGKLRIENRWDFEISVSQLNTDPFTFI